VVLLHQQVYENLLPPPTRPSDGSVQPDVWMCQRYHPHQGFRARLSMAGQTNELGVRKTKQVHWLQASGEVFHDSDKVTTCPPCANVPQQSVDCNCFYEKKKRKTK